MKKQAFSMITAIIFIILVSVVSVLTLKTSESTVSFATRNYIKEQAEMIYEGAKTLATIRWLQSKPDTDATKNGLVNITGLNLDRHYETYYYPDEANKEYEIVIRYMSIPPSASTSKNKENLLLFFDRNTILARISVETTGILKEAADIRIVRDFMISN